MKLSSNPKIIISRTDNIGDVVLTLPLAKALKEKYPQAEILFLGKKYIKPLIDCCENIDQFIDWDTLSTMPEDESTFFLKAIGAEVIVHVFPRPEIARMAYKAGIKYRIGTSHRFYNWLYCNKRVDFTRKNSPLHEAQLNFKLAELLGITTIPTLDELGQSYGFTKLPTLNDEWKKELNSGKFNLILHPLSRGSARNWDWKNYNRLIEILPADKVQLFITGTEAESVQITENILMYHPDVTDMTGRLDFAQLIAFIANADALVAASTGPLHIAAALGKRTVGLYPSIRPMHPGRWAPLGPKATYLALNKDCIDCKAGGRCACINSITAEQVVRLLY
ncbi:MAG TPA: glycosyltransferase family 9 protein [Bacteroidia bacterium]|nr:glycosyltransferase family 9 protein [Bacteroidia bacterium]